MALATQDKVPIEQCVMTDGPSTGVAYALWFFPGIFAAHHFHLGRPGTAVLQILLNVVVIGLIWVLIEAFLVPGMVRAKQSKIRDRLALDAISAPRANGAALALPA